jgi:dihydrofolate reductase
MYETMRYWQTADRVPRQSASAREFAAIWQAAEKIVFSTTLRSVSSAKTRIERTFGPAVVRRLKSATERDMTVGGAGLAGQATKAGLVDELQLFLVPSSSEAVSERSLTVSARIWNCWTRSGSQVVLFTSGTARRQRDQLAGPRRSEYPDWPPGPSVVSARLAHAAQRAPAQIPQIRVGGDESARSILATQIGGAARRQ